MAVLEGSLQSKYGPIADYYRRQGLGTFIDEGLAVLGETNSFDLLGSGVEGLSDLQEVNQTFLDRLLALDKQTGR
jgi:hypothetical protein